MASSIICWLTGPQYPNLICSSFRAHCAVFSWGAIRTAKLELLEEFNEGWFRKIKSIQSFSPSVQRDGPPADGERSRADADHLEAAFLEDRSVQRCC